MVGFANIFNTNLSAEIINKSFKKKFKYDNIVLLTVEVKTFEVKLPNMMAEEKINKHISDQVEDFCKYAYRTLYPMAIKDYQDSKKQGYPFREYAAVLDYTVTYNNNCFLSFYYDEYTFTGGAHGSTIRRSSTFNLKTGNLITLSYYFNSKNYIDIVLNEIIRQANENYKNDPGIYFENYEELIKETFDKNNYYLSDKGIVIYFNQYDIAPYAVEIVEFVIPYTMVDNKPKC